MTANGRRVWNVADTSGTPRTRALAGALRKARTDARFGVRELARRLDLAHTTISQWETGKHIPSVEDVAVALGALGVTGERRAEILDLARHAAEPNWLALNMPGVSQQLAGLMDCERSATAIKMWSPLVIPGILQTRDYARAIFSQDAISSQEVEARVTMRMGRRAILDGSDPVHLTAIIGEWALRERVGSPAVMADQLRFLLLASQWRSVTLRVLRSGGDWHPGLQGSFVIFDFAHVPSFVHLEHHRSGVFVYDEEAVAAFQEAVVTVQDQALSPEGSAELITEIMTEMEHEA